MPDETQPRYLLKAGEAYFASNDQELLAELLAAAQRRRLPCWLRMLATEETVRQQVGRLPNIDKPVEQQS